jgi:hypothetical protein
LVVQVAANSDIPDFATRGGNVSVQEGGKVTLPCQVNDLGSRTVSQVNDLKTHGMVRSA